LETLGAFKDLAHYIVESLVDNPDQVTVTEIDRGNMVIVEVQVDASDMGRVIGKGGNVVNSIRTLLQVLAIKHGKRVSLEIVED
jgi:hypothetical protein